MPTLTVVPSDPDEFDDWFHAPPERYIRRLVLSPDITAIAFFEGPTHFAPLTITVNTKAKRITIAMHAPLWRQCLTFSARHEPNLYRVGRRAIATTKLGDFAQSLGRRGGRDNTERSLRFRLASQWLEHEERLHDKR